MPIYEYKCPHCESQRTDIRSIAERDDGPRCDRDNVKMLRLLSPTPGIVKNPAVPRGNRG